MIKLSFSLVFSMVAFVPKMVTTCGLATSFSLLFFNSMFESIDQQLDDENSYLYQIEDKSEDPYLHSKLHNMLRNIMLKVLTDKEYHVIRLSYGINCDKQSAKQIAHYLDMDGVSSYVRVSQLKKQAINKLKNSLTYSQVADYL